MAFESGECFEGEFWLLMGTCRERRAFTVTAVDFFIIIIISFAWLFDEREVFMGLIHNRVAKVFHGNNSLNPWR